jgi:hypothetical protein
VYVALDVAVEQNIAHHQDPDRHRTTSRTKILR